MQSPNLNYQTLMQYKFALLHLFVLCFFSFSLTAQNDDYNILVSDYLNSQKTYYSFEDTDITEFKINNRIYSNKSGVTHLYVNQYYRGIPVFNAISSVAIKDEKVVYYANSFHRNINAKIQDTAWLVSPQSAISKAAVELELGIITNLELLITDNNQYIFTNSGISSDKIPVNLVYVSDGDDLKLAWHLIIFKPDNTNWWSVTLDAINGEIITSQDLIISCDFEYSESNEVVSNHELHKHDFNSKIRASKSMMLPNNAQYNVYALPVESPNHGSRSIVTNQENPIASPFGWHDTDGNIGAEYTITRGNNVLAKEDLDGQNENGGIGYSPDGSATLDFDYPLDFNLSPVDYRDAAITNLFYHNNMMHDIWYSYGFDEQSGNFQENNYGNGGNGNDFVIADAQDGSRFNNANFGTPPDGFNPRMQMFLWSPPNGDSGDRLTITNGSLAGQYFGPSATFGSNLSLDIPLLGQLALVSDGDGDVYDYCEPLINPFNLNGKIAVIRRGSCEFGFKVLAAENAGAIAAIVVNNNTGPEIAMGAGAVGDFVNIPSLMVSQSLGESIISALENNESINVELIGPDITDFIDGDFDNVIIAHEYGHGISNRLTGGASAADCLFNAEQMGEGWSDWFGLMITMKPTDTPEMGRGVGTFSTSQLTTDIGIRPARYSTDFAVNNATYNDSNFLSQPHGIGFVWATMLWDLTWAYINKYGFDSDLYNGTGGNNRVMQLVMDGLKLQGCSPGFVDGRDALLAADMITTGGENQCIIWDVFARRGLGLNASQGSVNNRSDQVENFDMPPETDPSLANCTSALNVDTFNTRDLAIYPNPTKTQLFIEANSNYGDVMVSLIDINGRVVYNHEHLLQRKVILETSSLEPGFYILKIVGDTIDFTKKILKN